MGRARALWALTFYNPNSVYIPEATTLGETPGWCVSNILVFLVEERKCLRVEGRGRSSRAKREPEGAAHRR